MSELSHVDLIKFNRYVINSSCSLQVFTDVSSRAYGVVAYSYSSFCSNLILSKQRVAPYQKKTLTIPKLELTAILIGCRLCKHLSHLFKFTELTLWTDSKVAISWIFSSKELRQCSDEDPYQEITKHIKLRGA